MSDPRSYEAAVRWAAIREAEQIVTRAANGPTSMQRLTRSLMEKLKARDEETE